ncbi:MAG: hypothetical protein EBQ98_04415, partial [Actinobacteria bacterium]|nr:hypothetical protein [Actinomycetota bacterium]
MKSSGLPLLHTSLIDAICQQTQGNPRQLALMTDIIARDHTALVHEDVLIQTLAQSDPIAQRMLMTLVLLKFKVSTRFLYAVNPVVFAIPEATLGEYLAQLRMRGLVTVINDLLDYSQIQNGTIAINPQAFCLHTMLHDAHAMLRHRA